MSGGAASPAVLFYCVWGSYGVNRMLFGAELGRRLGIVPGLVNTFRSLPEGPNGRCGIKRG